MVALFALRAFAVRCLVCLIGGLPLCMLLFTGALQFGLF